MRLPRYTFGPAFLAARTTASALLVAVLLLVPVAGVAAPVVSDGLVLHLDASGITGLSDGDPVAIWADQSGQGNDATQTTPANQPRWVAGQIAGKPVVSFNSDEAVGGSNWLELPDFLSGVTGGEVFAILRVRQIPTAASRDGIWRFGTSGSNSHYPYWYDGQMYLDWGRDTRLEIAPAPGVSLDEPHLLSIASGVSWVLRHNGEVIHTTAGGDVAFRTDPALGISGVSTAASFFVGDIAEILVYNRVLSDSEREAVEQYLGEKWLGWPRLQVAVGWGFNSSGELGDGSNYDRRTPVHVSDLDGVVEIAAGRFHSLALEPDGTVWAWGSNGFSQLGDGYGGTFYNRNEPVQVMRSITPAPSLPLEGIVTVTAGGYHNLAMDEDDAVWVWGNNSYGQLGDGTSGTGATKKTAVQAEVPVGVVFKTVAAGVWHSLALDTDGNLWSWGRNDYGQLGDGNAGDAHNKSTPGQVSGFSGFVAIAAGESHSLALDENGAVWAWGRNHWGQLGDGTNDDRLAPGAVTLPGGDVAVAIAAGELHSMALDEDGSVWAWGFNYYGQLGDGSAVSKNTAVQVSSLDDVVIIGAGAHHSLAALSDGTALAWGRNQYGQIGDGTVGDVNNRSTPVEVRHITNVTALAAGGYHSLGIGMLVVRPVALDLKEGWNLFSVPVDLGGVRVADVFRDIAYGDVYAWDPAAAGGSYQKYESDHIIDPHSGYWVRLEQTPVEPVMVWGVPVSVGDWSASLAAGWNMVGTAYSDSPIPFTDLDDGGSGALQDGAIYWWDMANKKYELTENNLLPGRGYWMATSAPCILTMGPPSP